MNYGAIKPIDIANGEGVRVSLFVETEFCFSFIKVSNFSFSSFIFASLIFIVNSSESICEDITPYILLNIRRNVNEADSTKTFLKKRNNFDLIGKNTTEVIKRERQSKPAFQR